LKLALTSAGYPRKQATEFSVHHRAERCNWAVLGPRIDELLTLAPANGRAGSTNSRPTIRERGGPAALMRARDDASKVGFLESPAELGCCRTGR